MALVVQAVVAVVHKAQVVAQAVKIKVAQATKTHNQAIQTRQLSQARQLIKAKAAKHRLNHSSQTSRKPQVVILATPAQVTKTKTKTKTKTTKQSK